MIPIDIPQNRRNEIKQNVFNALIIGNTFGLPVKIKNITRSFSNIRLISYSKHMKKLNLSYEQMIAFAESKDACTDFYVDKNMYYIYYNDLDINIMKSNRYRWNIAHELGHILLMHHLTYSKTRIFRSNLTDYEYDFLENEADYFAQLILVPHVPLYVFKITSQTNIMYLCQISRPASYKRFLAYLSWKKNLNKNDTYDKGLFKLYHDYIFKKNCTNCGASIIQEKGKFCPICGKKTLQWGDGKMFYQKIEAHPNGKLKICPTCHNEETQIEGNFCQICKEYLVNECLNQNCSNYDQALPTNARYCPLCGTDSVFLNNDILQSWDIKIPISAVKDGFLNIPDDCLSTIPDDVEYEELPFN